MISCLWVTCLSRGWKRACWDRQRIKGITLISMEANALQLSAPRRLTQLASRRAFQLGFDGVAYRSRFGHDIENWALFEPFKISPKYATRIEIHDSDLRKALAIHHLELHLPS